MHLLIALIAILTFAPAAVAAPQPLSPADGATVEVDYNAAPRTDQLTFTCAGSPYVRYSRSPQTGADGFLADGPARVTDDSSPRAFGDGRCGSGLPRSLEGVFSRDGSRDPNGERPSGGTLYWQARDASGVGPVRRVFVTLFGNARIGGGLAVQPIGGNRQSSMFLYGVKGDAPFATVLADGPGCAQYAERCGSRRWVIKRFAMEVSSRGALEVSSRGALETPQAAQGPGFGDGGGNNLAARTCATDPASVGGETVHDNTVAPGPGDDRTQTSSRQRAGQAQLYCAWSLDLAPEGGIAVRLVTHRIVTSRAPLALRLRATRRSGGHLLSVAATCRYEGAVRRCLGTGVAPSARADGRYTVERKSGGRWRAVGAMRLDASKTYRLRATCRKRKARSVCAGDRLRVRFAETDDAPASSAWQHEHTTSKAVTVR